MKVLTLLALAAVLPARTPLAPLEAEPASARVAALGGAGLGLGQGEAWELDPAGLALGPAWRLSADQADLALGLQRQSLRAQWGGGPGMGWGLRLSHLGFGVLERRGQGGEDLGRFEPRRLAGGLGFGWKVPGGFSLGSGLALFRQDLGGTAMAGSLAGLAGRWAYARGQHLGLAMQASSAGMERLAIGTGGILPFLPGTGYALQATGEQDGRAWSGQAGLEQSWGPAALRLGWRQGMGAEAGEGLAGLSAGLGLAWRGWSLDYAWQPLGALGWAQRLSLSLQPWSAPGLREQPAPQATPEPLPPDPGPLFPPTPDLDPPQPVEPPPALQLEFRLPDDPVDQAHQAREAGDWAQARARFEEALKLDPRDTRAWLGLGHLHHQRGDLDTAIQCFEQVLRLNPTETRLKEWLEQVKAARRK